MQTATKKTSSHDQSLKKRTATPLTLNDPTIIPFVSPVSDTRFQQKATCACGGGCPGCINPLAVQAKLTIGRPGDRYEHEADAVAERVMRMPAPQIRSKPA